jgi:hypothetical protein
MNVKYDMEVPKTAKDQIKHPKLAEDGVIPKLGSSFLVVGKSGSGKTVVICNLLKQKHFYGGSFDKVFLISATGDCDDILDVLKIPEDHVFSDLAEGAKAIELIQKHQATSIEKKGNEKADQIGIILDDCIGDSKFIQSAAFLKSFIASRHHNQTVFLATQHLRKVSKICRMQASCIILFPSSQSETDTIIEEFCPPGLYKHQFQVMLEDAWAEPYQFISIHMKQPMATRYRKGLAEVYDLNLFKTIEKKKRPRANESLTAINTVGPISGESQLSSSHTETVTNPGSDQRQTAEIGARTTKRHHRE